jgi:hypothetical protein
MKTGGGVREAARSAFKSAPLMWDSRLYFAFGDLLRGTSFSICSTIFLLPVIPHQAYVSSFPAVFVAAAALWVIRAHWRSPRHPPLSLSLSCGAGARARACAWSCLLIASIAAAAAAIVDVVLFAPSPLLHLPSILLLPPSSTRALLCSDPHLVGPGRRHAFDQGEAEYLNMMALWLCFHG